MRFRLAFAAFGLVVIAACRPAPAPPVHAPAALPTPAPLAPTPSAAAPPSPLPSPTMAELEPTESPTEAPAATRTASASPALAVSLVEPATASPPHLIIPALEVDRAVVTVPVRAGNWDLTGLDENVGWLETTGQKPGDALAMAFVGHMTLTATRRGPFADLWRLPVGAEIIYRQGATDYVYALKYKVSASPDEARRLYVAGGQTLLLVTCSEWDYAAFNYARRLIVVAQAAGQRPAP